MVCRIGRGRTCATRRSLWARLHFGGSNGEEDDYVLGMRVDGKQNAEWYEEQLSRGLKRHTGVCEVWVPPPPPDPRAWWWKHYMEPGLDDGTVSYRTHKTYLDDAVLAAISDFDALPPNGTVFELCAGDGAFAARLLAKFTDVAQVRFRGAGRGPVPGLCGPVRLDRCGGVMRGRLLPRSVAFYHTARRHNCVGKRALRVGRAAGRGRARAARSCYFAEVGGPLRGHGLHAVVYTPCATRAARAGGVPGLDVDGRRRRAELGLRAVPPAGAPKANSSISTVPSRRAPPEAPRGGRKRLSFVTIYPHTISRSGRNATTTRSSRASLAIS